MNTFIIKREQDRNAAIAHIRDMELAFPKFVKITKYDPRRNNNQNALIWKWMDIMGNDLGYGKDELFSIMKARFLGFREINFLKTTFHIPKESKSLTKSEFSEFMSRISELAANLGIVLPAHEDILGDKS